MQVSVHHHTPEFPYSQLIVTVEFTTAGDESAQRCEEHTSQQVMYSATANCTPEHVDELNELLYLAIQTYIRACSSTLKVALRVATNREL